MSASYVPDGELKKYPKKDVMEDIDRERPCLNGISTRLTHVIGSARSAMHAASELPGGEPTDVDDAPAPAH